MKRFKTARVSFAIVFISIVVCLFFSVVGSYADDVKDTPLPVTEQIIGQDGDLTLLAGDVGVTMDYTEVNVAKGDHYGLNVTTNPVNASITWSIGNALVANVSSDGIITGLKEGTTTIIASFEYNG